jgi:asparagine synthase (glutamine-hydrolysing)
MLDQLIKDKVDETVSQLKRPFGIFLSGGVDSGYLAALTKPDIAFTCNFPYGPKYDELKYTKMTAEHLGLDLKVITPTKEGFENEFKVAVQINGVTSHFSLYPLYKLFHAAKKAGIKTILSGEGPDEYFGGYARYIVFLEEQEVIDNLMSDESLKNYKEMLDKYFLTKGLRYECLTGYDLTSGIIDFQWDNNLSILSNLGKIDLQYSGIETMEQKLAEHFGIKLVYPYMHPEIEKYAWNMPDHEKIIDGETKVPFRWAAHKYLPKEVVWRKDKMGGPIFPVNKIMGWDENGEFDKEQYLEYQWKLLQ